MDGGKAAQFLTSASVIRQAMTLAYSIDNFLDAHQYKEELIKLGKLAIIRTILQYEKNSALCLMPKARIIDALQNQSWHTNLFQSLVENCNFDAFKERLKQVTFIVFNYDRVLEQFLLFAIQLYYQVPENEAINTINALNIIHPYGQCGILPWQNESNNNDLKLDFGSSLNLSHDNQDELAKQIYTFTDKRNLATNKRNQAHTAILESERIISLGFAFHPMNMQWLDCRKLYNTQTPNSDYKKLAKTRTVFSSAMGMSESDLSVIQASCRSAFLQTYDPHNKEKVMFSDKTAKCSDFMSQFSLSVGYGNLVL